MADTEKIRFRCPHCNKPVNVARQYAGKRGKCPGCGSVVQIPVGAPDGVTPERMPSGFVEAMEGRPRAKKSAIGILLDELQLDRGLVVDATAKKFGYNSEQVKEGCRQVIALVQNADRQPRTWDDLESMIHQGSQGIWPDWVDLVLTQIGARRGHPFPRLEGRCRNEEFAATSIQR